MRWSGFQRPQLEADRNEVGDCYALYLAARWFLKMDLLAAHQPEEYMVARNARYSDLVTAVDAFTDSLIAQVSDAEPPLL